jgi:hypothetical protein
MNTNTTTSGNRHIHTRVYDPAAALNNIIDSLGSATPWAMLALCSMSTETGMRHAAPSARPPMRTVGDARAGAPRSVTC